MSQRLKDLRAKQAATAEKIEALIKAAESEAREVTDDEQTALADLEAELDGIVKEIEKAQRVEALKAKLARPVPSPRETDVDGIKVPAQARRYSKLKAFRGETAQRDAYLSGMFFRATMMQDAKAIEWCKDKGVTLRAMSEGVNSAGGFLVPTEFETAVIDLREEYGVFRQNCRVVPMGSDSMTIPRRAGGVTAYWVGENSQITESAKAWDQVQLSAKKLAALSRLSSELAEDAVMNVADDLAQEMAYAFAQSEDAAGWNGDGTSTYGGITGVRTKIINGSYTKSAIDAASGHDTFAEIDANDLAAVMAALPKYAERNAKWYCSQPCWALVFQRLIAAAGGVTIGELTGGKPMRQYLGYPVVIDQTLPTATTDISDTAMLFFGDLSMAARLGERRGITVKTSGDRYFEYDQMGVQATERVDINVHDLGSTSVAGPLIALIGE